MILNLSFSVKSKMVTDTKPVATTKKAAAVKKPKPKTASTKPKLARKPGAGKKKKQVLKFHIECKNPVEDGILKTQNFVGFEHDRF